MKPLDAILSIVCKLCEPSSAQKSQDPRIHTSLWKRNKLIFWVLLNMTVTQPFMSKMSTMSVQVNSFMMTWNVINFLIFVMLCRSYIWYFYFYFAVVSALVPAVFLPLEKDLVFPYFGFSQTIPILVVLISNDLWLMTITGGSQAITSVMIFKDILRNTILHTDIDIVVEKLVYNNVGITALMMLLVGLIIRTMNKSTKDLAHANKVAEEALDQQKTFVFSFSHELRNPLNSLLGNLQLILMTTLPEQTKEMVRTSQICAELLLQLVNNILDIGKCDIGKLEINPSPTKVHDLFQRIWAISGELISRKKLKSHIKVEKRVPSVLELDSHRLNQIMMNLIGNAIKFTDNGLITVTVSWLESASMNEKVFEPNPYDDLNEGIFEKDENLFTLSSLNNRALNGSPLRGSSSIESISSGLRRRTAQSDDYFLLSKGTIRFDTQEFAYPQEQCEGVLKIVVRDTGCGMSEAAVGKLFQKFSQVSTDVHKRQMGTGLGLYITKEICKKMGSDVHAYSKVEVGTTFIICLPTRSVVHNSQLQLDKTQTMMMDGLSQRELTAIVADDSPYNVTVLCKYFSKVASRVLETAEDGLEAVKKYKKSIEAGLAVDIVTLDIDMPKMDGKTACQRIREYERQKGLAPTTIILISGNYDEDQVKECLDTNGEKRADCFLRKPLSFEDFSAAVYRLKVRVRNH